MHGIHLLYLSPSGRTDVTASFVSVSLGGTPHARELPRFLGPCESEDCFGTRSDAVHSENITESKDLFNLSVMFPDGGGEEL